MSPQPITLERGGERIVEGEFEFTRADFRNVAAMLRADAGIYLPEAKATLVYSRLAKRLRGLRLASFAEYCVLVAGPEGGEERAAMLAALTTNVTKFFREPHHFDYLRSKVLEPRLDAVRAGGRLRIWSAGCSTGQEPYSTAMTVLALLPQAVKHDVRILATDIDPNVIATAEAGVYGEEAASSAPAGMRDRYLKPDRAGGQFTVSDDVRALVTFRRLNLMEAWPMKGKFDAIFCRNVVIYFDEPTQERMWARFRTMLAPEGRLFVGHSERVGDAGYETDGLTAYKLKQGPTS